MKIFLIIFLFLNFAFSIDLDFDGIDDNKDYCPRSPLLAIVDKNGCEVKKNFPFNFDIEVGYEFILLKRIKVNYFKNKVFHTSYEATFYISRVQFQNSYKIYSRSFDFSKKFFDFFGYYKLTFSYYSKTNYNKESDFGGKFSIYSKDLDILTYYKLKRTNEKYQTSVQTFFIEKFLRYPKIIVIPFFYLENSLYEKKFQKYFGLSAIIKVKSFYFKLGVSESFKNGEIFIFSIGKNF